MRAFPRAAQEGTSPAFCRARVSVYALTSLSTSVWLLSSVSALLINFPHYPLLELGVNGEISPQLAAIGVNDAIVLCRAYVSRFRT